MANYTISKFKFGDNIYQFKDAISNKVTNITAGDGLTGGSITSTGTLKANLRSFTKLTNDSTAAQTDIIGKIYPIVLDKSGFLAVSVPWTSSGHVSKTITLTTAGWNNKVQNVSVSEVTANNDVIISAAPNTTFEYINSNIRCTAQAEGMLTFTCETVPTSAININILIM